MTTIPSSLRRVLRREQRPPVTEPVAAQPGRFEAPPVEIAPNDPLIAYFSEHDRRGRPRLAATSTRRPSTACGKPASSWSCRWSARAS